MGEFVSTLPAWIDPRTMPTCDCWAALGANALCPQCVAAVRAYEAIHAAHTAALQSEKARADAADSRIAALGEGMRGLVARMQLDLAAGKESYTYTQYEQGRIAEKRKALHDLSALLNLPAE